MDHAFWKTVLATMLGVLVALAIAFGVQQYGLQHLVSDLNKSVLAYPVKPAPGQNTAQPAVAPPPSVPVARVPAPEATPNGALPDIGPGLSPAAAARAAQPRASRGDILVIAPAGGGPKLLTNLPDGGSGADLSPEERAARQAEVRRKDAAWRKFYERPAGCDKAEGPALVECANHYIRARRSFDTLYAAGKL